MTAMPTECCFAPVVDGETQVLILGSLPGVASLRAGRYYAHPQNQFWRLIGSVIGAELQGIDYENRLPVLCRHKVGLWDTVAKARRTGSLDSAIRDIAANDLNNLTDALPKLRLIAFNGQKAAQIGLRQWSRCNGVSTTTLASSSPAYTLDFETKLRDWQIKLSPALF